MPLADQREAENFRVVIGCQPCKVWFNRVVSRGRRRVGGVGLLIAHSGDHPNGEDDG